MSTVVNKPKKIKIRIAAALLCLRSNADFGNDNEPTVNMRSEDLAQAVKPMLMIDENVWTYEQAAVWAAMDAICDALDNQCTDKDLEELADTLETALGEL